MSSENLNIDVNPLEEKSDKIEFTVDKLGLTNPARTIPTDVDYFIRKQQGDLESKYTFPQAVKKAFEIDNLLYGVKGREYIEAITECILSSFIKK